MGEKHSAVGYLFREGAFLPAQETKPVRNEFGLDLFQHRGSVYEGKTGLQFCSLQQAEDLAGFVEKHGGIEKVQKLIADSLERTGLSPRYTRPDEKKKDIFPPKEKDENRVFAKDLMGNKHYYYRFYNENGIELYTMRKEGDKEKIYFVGDDCHLLCVGATRSGKSRCLVLESICLLGLAGESIFCSDPKAELFHYTADFLKKLGYEVLVLDFKNPEKSMRYNLLQPIIDAISEGDTDRAEMLAWDLTNNLVGKPEGEKIWTNGECSIIAAAILCVVCDNQKRPEFQNMTNVYWFISEMCRTIGNKMPLLEYVKKLSPSHPARALLSISDVAPSRTRGSFYTSALTTLRLFTSKSIYAITHTSDFTLADMGSKKQALFVILPDEKTTFYPIASLIVSQQYELLAEAADRRGGRLERRVNFILDEYGNFTPISDMTNKLTVAAGRGMRYALFVQGFDQLKEKYSDNIANTIKGNCQVWAYLQSDDPETLREMSDKLGSYTTSSYQLSASNGKWRWRNRAR